jgi:SAM-dependent methyltransferase
MNQPYDQLAWLYDLVHANVRDDIPLYLALAAETGGPVLELGCGSGRTLVPLAEAGYEVVGLDNSEAMLERARTRLEASPAAGHARLVHADMSDFDLGVTFPLITVPFHTWMHLTTRQAQLAALACIRRHLRPGGRLVIHLPAPATIVEAEHDGALVLENNLNDPETGETVLQFSSTQLDEELQLYYVTWVYDRIAADGTVRRLVVPMTLHYLFPHQADLLLRRSGLDVVAMWGNYDRSPYTGESDHLIIVARQAAC